MVVVSEADIQNSTEKAWKCRNNLVTSETIATGSIIRPKVCWCCDCFILHGEEVLMDAKLLRHGTVKQCFSKNDPSVDFPRHSVSAGLNIQSYYTPISLDVIRFHKDIVDMYASPQSYVGIKNQKKGTVGIGTCKSCYGSVVALTRKDSLCKPPRWAIANGLAIGGVPSQLMELNDVEIAMVSLARVNKHVFSFEGGAHTMMVGWHKLFYHNVEKVSSVTNWILQNEENENGVERDVDDVGDGRTMYDEANRNISEDSDEESLVTETNDDNGGYKLKLAEIVVVITGPFTEGQLQIIRKRTTVNWMKIRRALDWLKANNILYEELDITTEDIAQPIFVENVQMQDTTNDNIEKKLEFHVLFPDSTNPDEETGGFENKRGFKKVTMERVLAEGDNKQTTMVSTCSGNILRDYQDDNLLKAFPRQFPYGVGNETRAGDKRSGELFLRYLSMIARKDFHSGTFVCVIHNMTERSRMVNGSYLRHSRNAPGAYTGLTENEMKDAVKRAIDGAPGNSEADIFLKNMKSATACMSHTEGAAKKSRQQIFATISMFGLPAIMLTVTPPDQHNFRIEVMYHGKIPQELPDNLSLDWKRKHLEKLQVIRREYPGLCALDYDNVMRIVVENFVGWNVRSGENIKNQGIYGDVDAFVVATEEQSRKTLHGHILIWLTGWNVFLERVHKMPINNAGIRDQQRAERELCRFAEQTMNTSVLDESVRPCEVECPNHNSDIHVNMEFCDKQSVRNLRTKLCGTNTGKRSIMRCNGCGKSYRSEDVAFAMFKRYFGQSALPDNVTDENVSDIWENQHFLPNCLVLAEFAAYMHMRNNGSRWLPGDRTRFCISVIRNLHKTSHTRTCFKGKDRTECRMGVPSCSCPRSNVVWGEKVIDWWCHWTGRKFPRRLFWMQPKRNVMDIFGNVYSREISNVFGCNTNVITCVDGGSAYYLTNYSSKNTQKEDTEKSCVAATHMIKNMKEKLKMLEDVETEDDEAEQLALRKVGLSTMIGAVLMATGQHSCSSTMAAYLTRNRSRFQFSHEFAYVSINHFWKDANEQYSLDSTHEGVPFITSNVDNYTKRPEDISELCLYEFLSSYSVGPPGQNPLQWHGVHPSGKKKAARKSSKTRIPIINHMDFVHTATFEGEDIWTFGPPHTDRCFRIYNAMEAYSKNVCLMFVPFRNIEELKLNGSYLQRLRTVKSLGKWKPIAERVLTNIQLCRNSSLVGRPVDPLLVNTRNECLKNSKTLNEINQEDDAFQLLVSEITKDDEAVNGLAPKFRNRSGTLNIKSYTSIQHGKHRCGTKFTNPPVINLSENLFRERIVLDNGNESEPVVTSRNHFPNLSSLLDLCIETSEIVVDEELKMNVPVPTGTLKNMTKYAEIVFSGDIDQQTAFLCIMSRFVLRIYERARDDSSILPATKKRKLGLEKIHLERLCKGHSLVALLNGPGGCGKSHVLKRIVSYAKLLCKRLNMVFTSQTIVMSALTGAAAVSIRGETSHSALCLCRKVGETDIERWENTLLVVVDEVSFASKHVLRSINANLQLLKEKNGVLFGGLDVVFAGDFSQLEPVGAKAIYLENDFGDFFVWINVFLELKTNHRFKSDTEWGNLLLRTRDGCMSDKDEKQLDSRVVKDADFMNKVPSDCVYATATNMDRMAINDGIFAKHLRMTHNRSTSVRPPLHTICIRAGDIKLRKRSRVYVKASTTMKDILYACCGEAFVQDPNDKGKRHDLLLKLYHGRPVMINDNLDVGCGLANGSMCEFVGVTLKPNVRLEDLEIIQIDGYNVWCASTCQVEEIHLTMTDHGSRQKTVRANQKTAHASFPLITGIDVPRKCARKPLLISFEQFPIVTANARTVHKLQGRTIKNLFLCSWNYAGNWAYVALSRVTSLSGLFLREKIDRASITGLNVELEAFMASMREKTYKLPDSIEL